jgi:ribosomal protein S18 acetylase RimI-like enzyme
VEIRLATEEDLPVLAEMYLRLFRHVQRTEGGTVEEKHGYAKEKMGNEDHFIFLAEVEGEAVGTIAVRLLSEELGFILDAWVESKHRRRHVMTELKGGVIEFLRKRGVTMAELKVRTDNEQGMRTWPRMGYGPFEIIMRKKI